MKLFTAIAFGVVVGFFCFSIAWLAFFVTFVWFDPVGKVALEAVACGLGCAVVPAFMAFIDGLAQGKRQQ